METLAISQHQHHAWCELGKQAAANVASRMNASNANEFAAQNVARRAEEILGRTGEIDFAKALKLQSYVQLDLTSIINSRCVTMALADFVGGAMRFLGENPD